VGQSAVLGGPMRSLVLLIGLGLITPLAGEMRACDVSRDASLHLQEGELRRQVQAGTELPGLLDPTKMAPRAPALSFIAVTLALDENQLLAG
jgi:hypothetical protein